MMQRNFARQECHHSCHPFSVSVGKCEEYGTCVKATWAIGCKDLKTVIRFGTGTLSTTVLFKGVWWLWRDIFGLKMFLLQQQREGSFLWCFQTFKIKIWACQGNVNYLDPNKYLKKRPEFINATSILYNSSSGPPKTGYPSADSLTKQPDSSFLLQIVETSQMKQEKCQSPSTCMISLWEL